MPLFTPAAGPQHPLRTPLILAVLLFVVGSVLVALWRQTGGGPTYPPADEQAYRGPPDPPEPEPDTGSEAALAEEPTAPPEPLETLDAARLAALIGDDPLPPERATDLSRLGPVIYDATRWLDGRSNALLALDAFPRAEWHYNRLWREPSRWRFKMAHVYGMLARLEPETVAALPRGRNTLWRATLYDAALDVHYTVLAPRVAEDVRAPAPGERAPTLAADGLFLTWYAYKAARGWERTPLFLAKRLYRAHEAATPPERLDERLPGEYPPAQRPNRTAAALDLAFLREHMYAPSYSVARRKVPFMIDPREAASNLADDFPALAHAFAYVHGKTADELRAARLPGMDYADILAADADDAPGWMLGQPVAVRGYVVSVRTVKLAAPDALGLARAHVVTVRAGRAADGGPEDWAVAVLDLPEELRFNDRVDAVGVFLKRLPYSAFSPEGPVWRWAPLLAAREITYAPPPPVATWPYWIVVGITVVTATAMFFAVRRGNREIDALRVAMKARRRERRPIPAIIPRKPRNDESGTEINNQ